MTRLRAGTAFGRRLLPVLCLVSFLLSLAEAARQPYPISLSDQSPSITYTPSVLGASSGCHVSYSQSPWSSFNSGQANLGKGASSHWTNYSGAVISFSFVGTGFTAYGDTSGNMTSILQLDGSTISTVQNKVMSTRPTLASATNLQEGYHTVSLTTKGTGGLEFDGVDLVLGSGAVNSTTSNITQVAATSNTSLNTAFTWSTDDWSPAINDAGTAQVAFTAHPNASYTFSPPSNTSLLFIYSSVSSNASPFTVTLSSPAYSSGSTNSTTPQSATLTPLTPWAQDGVLVFYATLQPGYAYAVKVENEGPEGEGLSVARVVFVSASSDGAAIASTSSSLPSSTSSSGPGSGGQSSHSNTGTIVGAVIGVCGAVAIALLVWFLLRRRQKAKRDQETAEVEKPFQVDEYKETTESGAAPALTPYLALPPADAYDRLLPASDENPNSPQTSSSAPSKSATNATRPPSSSQRLTPLNTTTTTSTGTSDPSQPSTGSVSGYGSGSGSASAPVLGRDRSFSHKWEVLAAPEGRATGPAGAEASGGLSPHKWEVLVAPRPDTSGSAASASQTSLDRLPRSVPSGIVQDDGDDHAGGRNVRVEVDAGRLDEGTEVLPPGYDPAWLAQTRRE